MQRRRFLQFGTMSLAAKFLPQFLLRDLKEMRTE